MSSAKETKQGMTTIVKTITKFVAPLVILFGIYLVLHGHLTPGGGFPGGVIVASGFILLVLSSGKQVAFQKLKTSTASVLESVGVLIFLSIAILGMATGGWFLINFLPQGHPLKILSAGTIPVVNIGIGIKVSGGIFAVFLVLTVFKLRTTKNKK